MEKNTVVLSLSRYEELKELEKKITSGHILERFIKLSPCGAYGELRYYHTKDEVLVKMNEFYVTESRKINKKILEISEMNYFQFKKWKREFNK